MKRLLMLLFFSTASLLRAETDGELAAAESFRLMSGLTNVSLKGYWDMSYESSGAPKNLHVPYRLVVRKPDRLFLELGSLKIWHDGETLTLVDNTRGSFLRTNAACPTAEILASVAAPLMEILPPGHRFLLESGPFGLALSKAESLALKREEDNVWKARSAWTLVAAPANRPGYRQWVDQNSGITVEAVSLSPTALIAPDDCRTIEQEMVQTFRHHFSLEQLDTRSVPDEHIFAAQVGEGFKEEPRAYELVRVATRPQCGADLLASIWQYARTDWSLPGRPGNWKHRWTTRLCGNEPTVDYENRCINRIQPAYAVVMSGETLTVLRVKDGVEEARITPPGATTTSGQFTFAGAWVRGETPEDDRLIQLVRSADEVRLRVFNQNSEVITEITGEAANFSQLFVLPAGGPRKEMLGLENSQSVRLLDPVAGETWSVFALLDEAVEITDRDSNRRPEFTFIGRDVSCYEWPDRGEEVNSKP